MKSLCCFLVLTALVCSFARADIAPPRPCNFVVRNLNAFPDCHFAYRADVGPATANKSFRPIKADESYRFPYRVQLFVQKGDGPYLAFRTLEVDAVGGVIYDFSVNSVEGDATHLKVKCKDNPVKSNTSPNHAAAGSTIRSSLPYFLLGGISLGALILRRRTWAT